MTEVPVIFEDNHIIIAEKPCNMPVQADSSKDDDMFSILKRYLKVKYDKPGNVYLGLVHRLDRPVGGVMAFAKTSKAAARLSEQLRLRKMKRLYLCIVHGSAKQRDTLVNWLLKGDGNFVSIVEEGTNGAKQAILNYEKQTERGGLSLLKVSILTGRSHQIRVQLAGEGLPIVGDMRYGNMEKGQIALWGYSLELEHPTKKEKMVFCREPKGNIWDGFRQDIGSL